MSKDYSEPMMHCYRELFAKSTPSGDFDELVKNATVNERGQKEIPFMDYEIEEDLMEKIINDTCKKYKIKDKYIQGKFKTSIYLGCSPKSKRSC